MALGARGHRDLVGRLLRDRADRAAGARARRRAPDRAHPLQHGGRGRPPGRRARPRSPPAPASPERGDRAGRGPAPDVAIIGGGIVGTALAAEPRGARRAASSCTSARGRRGRVGTQLRRRPVSVGPGPRRLYRRPSPLPPLADESDRLPAGRAGPRRSGSPTSRAGLLTLGWDDASLRAAGGARSPRAPGLPRRVRRAGRPAAARARPRRRPGRRPPRHRLPRRARRPRRRAFAALAAARGARSASAMSGERRARRAPRRRRRDRRRASCRPGAVVVAAGPVDARPRRPVRAPGARSCRSGA